MPENSRPRATIVMAARERHALAEAAIDSIVSQTPRPYRLIYLDVQSPAWLRGTLAERAAEWGLEVARFDEPLWPQEARRRVMAGIDTDYVVFIDNDVEVYPGWLQALVACADETGAGVVGPLYLWSDGVATPRIHMAGGKLGESTVDGARILVESHQLYNGDPDELAAQLLRRPCDFVEYHCMLIRAELLRDGTLLDPSIRCVHEHIDTALGCRHRGYTVYFEPTARVNYLAHAEFTLEDLPFFRARWSPREAEASIAAFRHKWNVADDPRAFAGIRQFVEHHLDAVDALRSGAALPADLDAPMRRDELVQSRSQLLDLALSRGYEPAELALISDAYHVGLVLMDGGYRPCGRPFIDHLTGTAGVLVRYGFRAETVAAGLLHSVYSHCPPHPAGPKAAVEAVCAWLGGRDSALEKRVRAYTLRDLALGDFVLSDVFVLDAEVLAMVAANEVDMYLSGEFRYTGRGDSCTDAVVEAIAQVCRVLGVQGLAATLQLARRDLHVAPAQLVTRMQSSYRIGADRRSAVPMVSRAREVLEP